MLPQLVSLRSADFNRAHGPVDKVKKCRPLRECILYLTKETNQGGIEERSRWVSQRKEGSQEQLPP